MFDIKKQLEYWEHGADDAIDTAKLLIEKKKYLHGLFFCHLAIEKMIKAHVIKVTHQIPQKSHNLFRLQETANMVVDEKNADFFGVLMKYQLEGRYPDYNPDIPDEKTVNGYLHKTKELLSWLKKTL